MTERVLCVGAGLRADPGLLTVARGLAGPEGAVFALLDASSDLPSPSFPVDRTFRVAGTELDPLRSDHLGAAVVAAVRASQATLVLSGPSKNSREGLSRAGALLSAAVITAARSPRIQDGSLEMDRDLLSGNATSVERVVTRPVLLALADEPPTLESSSTSPGGGPTEPLAVELPSYPFRRVSLQPKPPAGVRLESADRIVSVGRGLRKKEDLALIEELARTLGAAVGCTRPIAAEAGWLTDDHWVGLTGHRVRPSLYLAVGISGAAQHLVGMRDSRIVVAINQDANAPIFQQADFQVVGDLYAIVPELTRRLATGAKGPS